MLSQTGKLKVTQNQINASLAYKFRAFTPQTVADQNRPLVRLASWFSFNTR